MTTQAVLGACYGLGVAVFIAASAAWFEFHCELGNFKGTDAGDFYFGRVLLALVWPVTLPSAVVVLLARRRARRMLADRQELQRIDAIVDQELRLP